MRGGLGYAVFENKLMLSSWKDLNIAKAKARIPERADFELLRDRKFCNFSIDRKAKLRAVRFGIANLAMSLLIFSLRIWRKFSRA